MSAHPPTSRRKRVVGVAALALLALFAALVAWRVTTRDTERDVREGLVLLWQAIEGRAENFERAATRFQRALRLRPFDPYPAFLLRLTEFLANPRALQEIVTPSPFERAVALTAEGRPHEARLLLMRRPAGAMQPDERMMLRALETITTSSLVAPSRDPM